MKLRIVSDGTGFGTSVWNVETNEYIGGIQSMDWNLWGPWEDSSLSFVRFKMWRRDDSKQGDSIVRMLDDDTIDGESVCLNNLRGEITFEVEGDVEREDVAIPFHGDA